MARRKQQRGRYGDGTIYTDSQTGRKIIEVPDGHGGRIRRRAADAAAAKTLKAELIRKRDEQINLRGGSQTFQAFVNSWWDKVIQPKNLKPKTIEDYRATVERYLLPILGQYRLEEIDAETVLDLVHRLREEFSENVANHALKKLHMILEVAVRWRYVPLNTAAIARYDVPVYHRATPRPLTIEESARLLRTVEGHRLEALYWVAVLLGLRLGELLGLDWRYLNWERAELEIMQQVQMSEGKTGIVRWTKTTAGRRTLPVPPGLLARLRDHWQRQQQERERLGVNWHEYGLIFPSEEGTPLIPSNFERHWRGGKNRKGELLDGMRGKAGLPKTVKFHHMRHTCATRLGELGVIEEVRAAILGHSKQNVTQYYTHATFQAMRRALQEYEQMLLDALEDQRRRAAQA